MDRVSKILVLHLEHRKDRFDSIMSELNRIGLADKTEIVLGDVIVSHGTGTAGISDGHLKCIERAIRQDYETVMILQDDCKFLTDKDEFYSQIEQFMKSAPADWDGVWFGSFFQTYDYDQNRNYAKPAFIIHDTATLIHKRYYHKLAEYYKECRDRYIESGDSKYNIDSFISTRLSHDNIFVLLSKLCSQADNYSDRTFEVMNGGSFIAL